MARYLSCGFEEGEISSKEVPWGSIGTTGLTLVSSNARSGGSAIKCTYGAGNGAFAIQLSSSHAQYARAWINLETYPNNQHSILMFIDQTDGIALCYISINTNGSLALKYSDNSAGQSQQGSNSPILPKGGWHSIDLRCDDSAGLSSMIVEARLDGVVFGSGTVVSNLTGNGGLPSGFVAVGWAILGESLSSGAHYLDDVVINDGSGSSQNSYPGATNQLLYLRPNAAGDNNAFSTQVGGTAGSANNFTRVNEIPPDDTTSYNADTVLGNIDDFVLNATPSYLGANDVINCVQVMVRYAGISTTANASFEPRIKKVSGGTVSKGTAITPTVATFTTAFGITLYSDPDGNPWTKSTLDTTQIGYDISTTNTNGAAITGIWLVIDYTHPAEVIGQHSYLKQGFQ